MKAPKPLRLLCVCAAFSPLVILTGAPVRGENWPQWRGPKGNGISSETNVPVRWDKEKELNVAWRLPMPGPAGATPVVWNDRIFLTSVEDNSDQLLLLCVSTKGEEIWRRKLGEGNKQVRRDEGNSASPSPSTDGEFVWAMMTSGDIACYDFGGNEIWKFNLQDRYGRFDIQFGMTSTPVLYKDRLFLQLIHGNMRNEEESAIVVALDKRTGKEVWKHPRITRSLVENKHSYASPILYDDGQLRFLITHGGDHAIAHSLDDGRELWRLGGLNPHGSSYHTTLRFVSSPAAAPGLIVVPTAKNGPVVGVRPDGKGDITRSKSANVWRRKDNTPDVPSPLIHDGIVYLCRENGNLLALDAKTGEQLYEHRTEVDRHRASPVYADGNIYLTARKGVVTVVKAGPEFEIVARNQMNEDTSASPVISSGTLYIRTFDNLWAIRNQ